MRHGREPRLLTGQQQDRLGGQLPAGSPEALRGLSDAVCELAIPASAWTVDDQLARLTIAVRGRPTGRCVALGRDRVELAGPSAWLPVLLPQRDLHWRAEALDTGLSDHWSTTATDARFLDLLALRGQASTVAVELEWPVSVVGAQPSGHLRHLGFLASRTGRLWQELAGALDAPCPPIVIVDRAASTFCYARAGYIRVPSGILYQAGQQRQLCHEIGHLWWGAGARFAEDAEWLAEGLAEYSLHLAEDAGYTPGYRADVLQRLGEQEPEVADAGLLGLARRTDAEGARTSRAKGGFFISMLRQVMGDDGFRELLRTCHRLGQTHILDAYTFLALASWIHRGSLRWFFNQWVFADTGLSLRLTRAESTQQGDRYHLVLQAECHGIATPGTRVDVVVYTSDGAAYRSALDLELGQAALEMTTPGRPERAVLARPHDLARRAARVADRRADPGAPGGRLRHQGRRRGGDVSAAAGARRRDGSVVRRNPNTTEAADLDSLPFPDYRLSGIEHIPLYPLVTSRDCPYKCTFCTAGTISHGRFRPRSAASAVDEIIAAKERYGTRGVVIVNENFSFEMSRAIEFCELMIEKQVNVQWTVFEGMRADSLTDELYHIQRAVTLAKKHGFKVGGYLIIGLPGSSFQKDMNTLQWALTHLDKATFWTAIPYLGTAMYRWIEKHGRILRQPTDNNVINTLGTMPFFETDDYPAGERKRAHAIACLRTGIHYSLEYLDFETRKKLPLSQRTDAVAKRKLIEVAHRYDPSFLPHLIKDRAFPDVEDPVSAAVRAASELMAEPLPSDMHGAMGTTVEPVHADGRVRLPMVVTE